MLLGHWLTIYFKKILTLLLWEIKKAVKILIAFFSFLIKFSLNELLTNVLKVFVSISLYRIVYIIRKNDYVCKIVENLCTFRVLILYIKYNL